MSDSEFIKKMLRSVLQSSKTGVSITNLQSEYQSMCGEIIPLKKLGFSNLEDYLRSIPSVVRLEYRGAQCVCFATVCEETAHIAELVAKQKNAKKSGCSQVVNCRMRFKPSNPYRLNVIPRSCLRQPSTGDDLNWSGNRSRFHGGYRGFSAIGDYRQFDQKLSSFTPMEHRQPGPQTAVKREAQSLINARKLREKNPERSTTPNKSQTSVYDVQLVQIRLTQLLAKFCSGLWMSKLSEIYGKTFNQILHPQALVDLENWTHICMVEQSFSNKSDSLIYPPLPSKLSVIPKSSPSETPLHLSTYSTITTPISSPLSTPRRIPSPLPASPVPKPRVYVKNPLANPTFIFPQKPVAVSSGKLLSSVTFRSPAHNPAVAPRLSPCVNLEVNATGGGRANQSVTTSPINPHNQDRLLSPTRSCPTSVFAPTEASSFQHGSDNLKVTFPTNSDFAPSSKSFAALSTEVCEKIKELLSKYSQGIWAHALPKLFMDTYKTPFPEHILDNMSLYPHIWSVEYPLSHNKKKAILYNASITDTEATECEESLQSRSDPLPSGIQILGTVVPPRLVLPSEQFPSVLVTDAKSSNTVTVRYVGENYSNAQETMEELMRSFYNQSVSCHLLPNPVVGQLVAIRGEDGDEVARGQVMEIMAHNRVKVYYVDYGFSLETSGTSLLELHPDFLSLPLQATKVRLAGLEAFSSHRLIVFCLDQLAVGKILLMERLEACQQNETPLAVLYDTSQDDDLNINAACLKVLQDETMSNPLTLNATYKDVCITDVCADGIIYCQLPSRGTARLLKLLEKTQAFFIAQMSSDPLVSRPFIGKICLAQYKGKWSRVEITNMHGNRVMEIIFIDLGVSATVEVTDLREIPPPLLKEFTIIPPQAIKCRLADLVPEEDWSPKAVQWVKETVLGSEDCKMKIVKTEKHKGSPLIYMYLFIGADSQELDKSINHQLTNSELWHKFATRNNSEDTDLSSLLEKFQFDSTTPDTVLKPSLQPHQGHVEMSLQGTASNPMLPLSMPPPLELPQPGQNIDVFVPVACHPGYFVLQPWQNLHKLVVLMGEMILYYNQTWKANTAIEIQKGNIYAAKIDKNWYRVQVRGVLTNGLVSVYELDHGKHELICSTLVRPLIWEFRQLPFQSITAQLAGVTQHHWSEESCMLFRNHVEKRALVAHVESVQELSEIKDEPWNRRLTVYLVDTTLEDRDLWIHNILADISSELSSAA